MTGGFLSAREDDRSWNAAGEQKGRYWVGEGANALEVVYTEHASEPSRTKVRKLWEERQGKRPSPVLLVAAWPKSNPERAVLAGPTEDELSIVVRDIGQAERLAARALEEPKRAFAIQMLKAALAEVDDPLPGVRNDGLLATHELRVGVPARKDWAVACERGERYLGMSDRELVSAMGYDIEQRADHAILRTAANGEVRAVAVFLDRAERPDAPSARFDQRTPVDAALLQARREGLRWVLAVRGSTLRLYSSATSGAAGQRGRTETFLELDLAVLETKNAGYLSLLFAADALAEGGTFDEVASASRDFTSGLSERLRDQVYEHTVPRLAAAIAARHEGTPDKEALDGIYHAALTVLFRLLFVAYAEDRRLLPSDTDLYRAASLKAIALDLAIAKNENRPLGFDDPFTGATDDTAKGSSELWSRCRTLFRAVDKGHPRWGIPAYNGGLFDDKSPEGKLIASLDLSDVEFGPALAALILDRSPDGGYGPIDFRSLSVREFGSIYEGLLENELAVAEQDLTVKPSGASDEIVFVPALEGDKVVIGQGAVYLHNASGARKSTGSYFTPSFAVDHILSSALVPRLDKHLMAVETLVDRGDQVAAGELLLDFRVVDISMGSGHFLTAAVDMIEAGITDLLARKSLPHFQRELQRLRAAARDALGESADGYEIEDSQLVRRLIARKCIYGIDLNPISVELARVSLWIHTFVPGLPLSFLDRTLVVGNSLVGIANVDEAVATLTSSGAQAGLFDDPVRVALAAVREPLRRLATISDASIAEVEDARAASQAALNAVRPVGDLFDLIVADRLGEVELPPDIDINNVSNDMVERAREIRERLRAVHFPILFPEVFLRDEGGFDVIVGNPPWEELQVKEHKWWSAYFPGVRSLSRRDYELWLIRTKSERPDLMADYEATVVRVNEARKAVQAGPYPGLQTGSVDLYKAFAWRNLQLARRGGRIGLVLPRTAFASTGSAEWREALFNLGTIDQLMSFVNRGQWLFESVHPQYSVVFLTWTAGSPSDSVWLQRVASSLDELRTVAREEPIAVKIATLRRWTDPVAVPLVQSRADIGIMEKMGRAPRLVDVLAQLDGRIATGLPMARLKRMGVSESAGTDSVAVLKGGSFHLWNPNLRPPEYYVARHDLDDKFRSRLAQTHHLAFRQIARSTDRRTLVVALLPPSNITTDGAPVIDVGSASSMQLYSLLGTLSSHILDWYLRRWVEVNVNQWLVAPVPVMLHSDESELSQHLAAAVRHRLVLSGEYTELPEVRPGATSSAIGPLEAEAAIDALVAIHYGMSEAEVRHVFATFHAGWKPEEREPYTEAVLEHFESFDFDPAPVGQE